MPKQCKKGAKIACIITGKVTYFNEIALKKKIGKFGDVEEFRSYFICNDAKRFLKQGMSVQQVREHLEMGQDLPEVDLEILYKLKLVKKKKQKQVKEQLKQEKIIESQKQIEVKQKQVVSEQKEYGAYGAYVRWATGTPNGGTCQAPHIYLNHNDESCDGCQMFEFCLCENKHLKGGDYVNKC